MLKITVLRQAMADAAWKSHVDMLTLPPTAHLVPYRKPTIRRLKVYGFLMNSDDAESRGKVFWNTPEALESLVNPIYLSFIKHMEQQCRAHWHTCLRPVNFEKEISMCITLADNIGDWKSPRNKESSPPRDVIDKLKLLLETDEEPKWYNYAC
jgi:hypothetical protein